jgi:hypothetical protein
MVHRLQLQIWAGKWGGIDKCRPWPESCHRTADLILQDNHFLRH